MRSFSRRAWPALLVGALVSAVLAQPAGAVAVPFGSPAAHSAGSPAGVTAQNLVHHQTARSCAPAASGHATCLSLRQTDTVQPHAFSLHAVSPADVPAGYGPTDLRSAYNLTATGSAAQTVAIVDAYDDPNAESDLAVYRAQYGLPACTTANGCFSKVNQTGGSSPLPPADSGWSGEISLDVDMVSAICPNCHILLVEGGDNSFASLMTAVDTAVAAGAQYVSNSYGAPEFAGSSTFDSHFEHPGVAFTVSTGDAGYGVQYPASSPDVTAVGGTSLLLDTGTTRGWSESAWGGAGSGCASYEPALVAQAGASTGCAQRAVADVSAVADPDTGVAVYQTYGGGGWTVYGGTSVAAPVIAGVYALAGVPAAGSTPNAYPYQAPASTLNDVTTGSTGSCDAANPQFCTARAGWDGPTGLGTPNGVGAFLGPEPGSYVALPPARVMNTRIGLGATGPVAAGHSIAVDIAGNGGVPATGASAVVLNVTVTDETSAGFATVYPDGTTRPTASNLNFLAHQTVPNLVVVKLGADGAIRLYNGATGTGTVNFVGDIAGYYLGGTPTAPGTFQALSPTRVINTRVALGASGPVAAFHAVPVQIAGQGGVPATGVAAVVINITGTDQTAAGYATVYPDLTTRPTASNLNYVAHQTVPNLVVVKLGSDGKIELYNGSTGTMNFVGDVAGYYLAGAAVNPGTFTALAPARVLNTRIALGASGPVPAGGSAVLQVTGAGGVPVTGVSAVVLNVTATDETAAGYATVYPNLTSRPTASNLNFAAHQTIPNQVVVQVGSDGKIVLYNGSAGTVNFVGDIAGYYRNRG